MAWGAWLVHDDPSDAEKAARMQALLKPDSSEMVAVADSATTRTTTFVSESGTVVVDTSSIPTSVVATADSVVRALRADSLGDSAVGQATVPVEQVALADTPVVHEPELQPVPEPMPVERPRESRRSVAVSPPPLATKAVERRPTRTSTRVVESRPAPRTTEKPAPRVTKKPAPKTPAPKTPPRAVASATKAPAKVLAKSTTPAPKASARKSSSRWVTTTSRGWVIVRASASPGARIIASVGPNTRVQLGESKGGWRRIKAKGLAGWVEHRLFYAGAGTLRGSRLAAR
jgi:hypothetical protein